MKIQNIPQNQIQNKKQEYKQQFTGISDALNVGLRFLDTNQAWGANAVDVGSMVLPRTTVDFVNRGPAAGMETGRREASGTINHSLIGVYGSMAALAFSLAFNKAFNIRADKIFADNETFDIMGKLFHDNMQANKLEQNIKDSEAIKTNSLKNLEKTLHNVFDNLSTTAGDNEKRLDEYQIQNIVKRYMSVLTNPDIDSDTMPKSTKQYLVNFITEATGYESDYKLKAGGVETTNSLSGFVENIYNVAKTFTKKNVIEAFSETDFTKNKFINGLKHINTARTIIGMGIGSMVGMSIQPLNIYLTKKKTGSDGFVGVEGREKDNSFNFKLWKAAAAAVFGGGIVANLAMKEGGLLKNIQFKGMIPTLNQFKLIYGMTIMSRFIVARDKDELRESVVKDVLGFVNWLVLGNFVAKGVALAMDKEKSLIKNINEKSFFKKRLKTRDEVMIEGLKSLNLKVTENGKALSFSKMSKLIPAGEKGKAIRKQLRILNIAQVAGYLYSGIVLGIGIPKLNIYMTNKSEEKRKAKLAAQKSQAQNVAVDYSLVNMKAKNINDFTAVK